MNYYLQIDASRVAVAITQTSAPIHAPHMIEWPSFDESLLGQRHDEASGQFVPQLPVVAPAARRITPLAFRRRFTKAERAAIEWAAVDRAELSNAERMQAAALRSDLKDQAQATYIDLDDPDVATGVQGLEFLGLLDTGRSAQIIDHPAQPEELPGVSS